MPNTNWVNLIEKGKLAERQWRKAKGPVGKSDYPWQPATEGGFFFCFQPSIHIKALD